MRLRAHVSTVSFVACMAAASACAAISAAAATISSFPVYHRGLPCSAPPIANASNQNQCVELRAISLHVHGRNCTSMRTNLYSARQISKPFIHLISSAQLTTQSGSKCSIHSLSHKPPPTPHEHELHSPPRPHGRRPGSRSVALRLTHHGQEGWR